MTTRDYNSLSAIFFLPNVPVPLIAGAAAQKFGPGPVYVFFLAIAFLGNLLVATAAVSTRYGFLAAGRLLMGISYEAADMTPIGLLNPYFDTSSWAAMIGLINGANRLGSIMNFVILPVVLRDYGLAAALLVASAIGSTTLLCGGCMYGVDRRHKVQEAAKRDAAYVTGLAAPPASAPPPPPSLAALREFSHAYWLYLVGAGCVYGAVVPFWFIGSKHIALKWRYSLAHADALMLWPEGAIALVAPPSGWLIDRFKWSVRTRLLAAAASSLPVAASMAMLAMLDLPPILGVGLLGIGYAFAQNLVWATITLVSPPSLVNLSSGFVGAACNVLPMLLPAFAFSGYGPHDVAILAIVGAVGSLAFIAAAAVIRP